ncbi:MAG: Uma2 family endonuclease, partial [bacterium]|nr:Uma2 family endonuclease [bacterium]
MPAGGLHGEILAYVVEILRNHLEKKELKLLIDAFMMYRDFQGIKQRVAPDLLLMPYRAVPSSYDFDVEMPPLGAVEVTSPKSHLKDKEENLVLYTNLEIPSYLVIDAVTPKAELRKQIGLYLWRKEAGKIRRMHPDSEGYLLFPEMDVRVKAIGQRLIFCDNATGEMLHDTGQLDMLLKNERHRAEQERK